MYMYVHVRQRAAQLRNMINVLKKCENCSIRQCMIYKLLRKASFSATGNTHISTDKRNIKKVRPLRHAADYGAWRSVFPFLIFQFSVEIWVLPIPMNQLLSTARYIVVSIHWRHRHGVERSLTKTLSSWRGGWWLRVVFTNRLRGCVKQFIAVCHMGHVVHVRLHPVAFSFKLRCIGPAVTVAATGSGWSCFAPSPLAVAASVSRSRRLFWHIYVPYDKRWNTSCSDPKSTTGWSA